MTWEEFFMLIQTILSGGVKKKEQPAVAQTNFAPGKTAAILFGCKSLEEKRSRRSRGVSNRKSRGGGPQLSLLVVIMMVISQ